MTTIRMLPPVAVSHQTKGCNGRTYAGAPGVALDIPEFDAKILQASGWVFIAPSGPTASRPTAATGLYPKVAGANFFDTTLGVIIVFDGSTWRNPSSGAAV